MVLEAVDGSFQHCSDVHGREQTPKETFLRYSRVLLKDQARAWYRQKITWWLHRYTFLRTLPGPIRNRPQSRSCTGPSEFIGKRAGSTWAVALSVRANGAKSSCHYTRCQFRTFPVFFSAQVSGAGREGSHTISSCMRPA